MLSKLPVYLHIYGQWEGWAILRHVDVKRKRFRFEGAPNLDFDDYMRTWEAFEKKVEPMEKTDKPSICEVLGVEEFERICEAVHNGWWDEKKRQGMTGHPDMIPYDELAEDVKEYDRVTVRRVLDALGIRYESKPRFTEDEVDVLKALYSAGARYLARGKHLRWYHNKPYQRVEDDKWDMCGEWGTMSGKLPKKLFPSILPGASITIAEVIGQ